MGAMGRSGVVPIVETNPQDIVIDCIIWIEKLAGGLLRFHFEATRTGSDGNTACYEAAAIVAHESSVPAMMRQAQHALSDTPSVVIIGGPPMLM